MLTIAEKILSTIKNNNKMLIDVNTLVKNLLNIQIFYIKQASFTGHPTRLEQKCSFRTRFGLVRHLGHNFFLEDPPPLNVRHCPKVQSCAISWKTNYANLRKYRKPFRTLYFFRAFYRL